MAEIVFSHAAAGDHHQLPSKEIVFNHTTVGDHQLPAISRLAGHHQLPAIPRLCLCDDIQTSCERRSSACADDYRAFKIPKLVDCPSETTPKLTLVLDLDHTLLHSTFHPVDNSEISELLYIWSPTQSEMMTTKLRPFVHTFLREAHRLGYDMYIYTMGSRSCACGIAEILDPLGIYFKSKEKIISRESTVENKKSLEFVPLADVKNVVIVDDTVEVCPKNMGNLITVKRYNYFENPKSEIDEMDDILEGVLDVLKRIKKLMAFFDDVWLVLEEMRHQILKGCRIVFTWDLPPNMMIIARKLGATCSIEAGVLVESTTHVVSTSATTMDGRWAFENGKLLVSPDWIKEAYYSWRHLNTKNYLLH